MGNPAKSLTILSQFVQGHTSKVLAFNIYICSTYLKALPAFALLDTIIQRSSCLIHNTVALIVGNRMGL